MQTTKHEFALFWQGKKSLVESIRIRTFSIDDTILFHRIITVLRAKKDDEFTLFDQAVYCIVKIIAVEKKCIQVLVLTSHVNNPIKPSVTFLLPLLKRDALHEAMYSLTEVGCTTIQLITTKKIHGSWHQEREIEKLQKIVIAAAEQSKNFNFPEILSPINLETALKQSKNDTTKIFFDPTGVSCETYFKNSTSKEAINPSYVLLIGPEGDLTQEEKDLVAAAHFTSVKLTQTILRAQQAATLGAGIVRSFIDK